MLCQWLTDPSFAHLSLSNADWDKLLDTAANSGILPSLQHNAAQPTLHSKLPEQIANLLTLSHSLNTERNQSALTQTHQLTAALNHAGIQPVALKGLANILTGIYPDVGTRYLADIDFLVPPNQFAHAIAVFQYLGYSTTAAHRVEFSIGHSYPPLTRDQSFDVDLHRTLGLGRCPSLLPASELIRGATVHNLGGASILIPSPNHLVMHHIMHSQMHSSYSERIAPSLRTLYDFYLLVKHFGSSLNWSAIESHFRRKGEYATLALYLLEAESTFGITPPVPLHLTLAIRLRRRRRQLLQNYPLLRFFDPFYYWLAGVKPRTRRLREILAQPGGIGYLLGKFHSRKFYERLRSDFG